MAKSKPVEIRNVEIKKAGDRGFRVQIPPGLINGTDYHPPVLQEGKKYKMYLVEQEEDIGKVDPVHKEIENIEKTGPWEITTPNNTLEGFRGHLSVEILDKVLPLSSLPIVAYFDSNAVLHNDIASSVGMFNQSINRFARVSVI